MSLLTSLLSQLHQQSTSLSVAPFVIDFCQVWSVIHTYVSQERVRKISKAKVIASKLKEPVTIPFYEKYKVSLYVDPSTAWMDYFDSLCLNWQGGRVLFPLKLITYELAHHKDNLFEHYLQALLAGTIPRTSQALLNLVIPHLLDASLPLSSSDVILLPHSQSVYNQTTDFSRQVTHKEFVSAIPQLSPETIRSRQESFRYFQMVIPITFLDLSKLGYETYLISHTATLPKEYHKYCLLSVPFNSTYMSVLQLPLTQPQLLEEVHGFLRKETQILPLQVPLTRRVHSWNLSNLHKGQNNWQQPFSFFHSDLSHKPDLTPPSLDFSLEPNFDLYRPLTAADIKLLTFISTMGEVYRLNILSKQLNLHRNTITRLLAEYRQHQLFTKVLQFYNLGADLRVNIYLYAPCSSSELPFLAQCQSLPRMDVFLSETDNSALYFGRVDIPHSWTYDFLSRLRFLRDSFPDLLLLYSFDHTSLTRWNLSLKDSYMDKNQYTN